MIRPRREQREERTFGCWECASRLSVTETSQSLTEMAMKGLEILISGREGNSEILVAVREYLKFSVALKESTLLFFVISVALCLFSTGYE